MNAVKASTVRGRFRRQVTSVMLVLSLSMGAIVATPTPAHAAGSHIAAQFSMDGYFPAPYSFGMSDMAGATAQVWLSLDGRSWHFHTYFKLNQLGRVDLELPGFEFVYFAIMVDHQPARLRSQWVYFQAFERSPYPKQALVTRY